MPFWCLETDPHSQHRQAYCHLAGLGTPRAGTMLIFLLSPVQTTLSQWVPGLLTVPSGKLSPAVPHGTGVPIL